MTIVEAAPGITGGVDTHLDKHVAAALDRLGRLVGTESFDADAGGYKALLVWLEEFGQMWVKDSSQETDCRTWSSATTDAIVRSQ